VITVGPDLIVVVEGVGRAHGLGQQQERDGRAQTVVHARHELDIGYAGRPIRPAGRVHLLGPALGTARAMAKA
jgi:hypothetical protein